MAQATVWEDFKIRSEKVSNLSRDLCLAGIGIVWIITPTNTNILSIRDLKLALILFASYLATDLLYYLIGVGYHMLFLKTDTHINEVKEDRMFSTRILKAFRILYFCRFIPLIMGYISLLTYFSQYGAITNK